MRRFVELPERVRLAKIAAAVVYDVGMSSFTPVALGDWASAPKRAAAAILFQEHPFMGAEWACSAVGLGFYGRCQGRFVTGEAGQDRAFSIYRRLMDEYRMGNPIPDVPFNENPIRRARLSRGMRVEAFAARSGVSGSLVSRWERGRMWPTDDHLSRMASSLSLTNQELKSIRGYTA